MSIYFSKIKIITTVAIANLTSFQVISEFPDTKQRLFYHFQSIQKAHKL